MGTVWTTQQKRAIDIRNADVLVSAAAGSGKTAVLTERILGLLTDPEHPMDVDRLLVVTFTKAAAGEMKNRIEKRLNGYLLEKGEDRHVRRQIALLPHARITTIDSFCLNVVKNHFTALSLDPDFRVAEEGEVKLLKADTCEAVLEDAYAEADPEFIHFLEGYVSGKDDAALSEYILKLAEFAESHPEPMEKLAEWVQAFEDDQDLEKAPWMADFVADIHGEARELLTLCQKGLFYCHLDEGPIFYEPAFLADERMIKTLLNEQTAEGIFALLSDLSFERLASKRGEIPYKEEAKAIRDLVKARLQGMAKHYGSATMDGIRKEQENGQRSVRVLAQLTRSFLERYAQAKRERNLADFADLEHMALQILTEKTPEGYRPSLVAEEMAEHYTQILIDEYQDSNRLQEVILTAVSGQNKGEHHLFHVGDVKQSIYQFRLARPELFLDKYHRYGDEGQEVAIELGQNFRSHPQVLSDINRLFFGLMRESYGGIEYDDRAALYPGRIPAGEEDITDGGAFVKKETLPLKTELLLCETQNDEDAEEEDEEAELAGDAEKEAAMIVRRIKELTDPETGLWLPEGEDGRRADTGDVAVLLRSFSGLEEQIKKALEEEGIPVQLQSREGYFQTYEVQAVLQYLSLLSNPRQDIPLAAVLKSPFASLSTVELALMAGEYRASESYEESEAELYDAAVWYRTGGEKEELRGKLDRFLSQLETFRDLAGYSPVAPLLQELFQATGFLRIMQTMPGGEKREANLEFLRKKAADFDATSYRGLYDFVRYIENIQKVKVDFGEAPAFAEQEKAVRIMTIHKSKGLEFPICFVSGLGRKFSDRSQADKILTHPDWGLALDFVDPEQRVKRNTFRKRRFAERLKKDSHGEELRVLYVAATRARDKLIFTATVKDMADWLDKITLPDTGDGKLPETLIAGAGCMRDWLGMAYKRDANSLILKSMTAKETRSGQNLKKAERLLRRRELPEILPELTDAEKADFERRLLFTYPYESAVHLFGKVTVSELKRRSMEEEDAVTLLQSEQENTDEALAIQKEHPSEERMVEAAKETESVPKTQPGSQGQGSKQSLAGADRGTAYHRLLELYPYEEGETEGDVRRVLEKVTGEGKMSPEQKDCIFAPDIAAFLRSPLGRRMKAADGQGALHRESRFVTGLSSKELYPETTAEELILLQGIIDAWFEEDKGLVLVDYKTDRVSGDQAEETLQERYHVQMDLYRKALEQMTGKKVSEVWIYSFALRREICYDREKCR